jgi:hypothetical protein
MRAATDRVLQELAIVDGERKRREANLALGRRVDALKHYQQARFRNTYRDLLEHPRYASASQFFLEELYGPRDFSTRDAQFARIVPALVTLFPASILQTVDTLAALHALSEQLDTAMGESLPSTSIGAADYVRAWQATGRREDRLRQVELTVEVGNTLDGYARKPMMGTTLRMMRGPAGKAGLSELQRFLEAGFRTFKAMHGAQHLLETIDTRERAMISQLFDPGAISEVKTRSHPGDSALVQLP